MNVHPALPFPLQQQSHRCTYGGIDKVQSVSSRRHGPVTALLKVCHDPSLPAGLEICSLLRLLVLPAVFDTVDQDVLVEQSEQMVPLAGAAWG